MQEVNLNFNTEDEGLNLTGTVNFPDKVNINGITDLTVRGLAEWRHVPANVVHVNERVVVNMDMAHKPLLAKVGVNWIGMKARSDILLSYTTRHGKNGTQKVQDQLTKFFKAIGASSIKFSVLGAQRAEAESNNESNDD